MAKHYSERRDSPNRPIPWSLRMQAILTPEEQEALYKLRRDRTPLTPAENLERYREFAEMVAERKAEGSSRARIVI